MIRFLLRRIGQAILVLVLSSIVVFGLYFVGPGPDQVARTFAGRLGTAARIAQIKHELHLDQPLYLQYGHWAWNLLQGNFGYDYYKGQSVSSVIAAAAPATISLVIGAAIIWIVYGVFTGVISAVRSRSLMDRAFTASALFFYSIPSFVLGLSLIWIFAYKLSPVTTFFPFHGYVSITTNPGAVVRAPHPALAHARPGNGGHVYPADPHVDARGTGRGLRQDRPVQGNEAKTA